MHPIALSFVDYKSTLESHKVFSSQKSMSFKVYPRRSTPGGSTHLETTIKVFLPFGSAAPVEPEDRTYFKKKFGSMVM